MLGEGAGRQPAPEHFFNQKGLLDTQKRDDSEGCWLSKFVLCILRVAEASNNECGNLLGLYRVGLIVRLSKAAYTMGNQWRSHCCRSRLAQGMNGQIVRQVIAELYDLWHTPEMFTKGNDPAECRFRQVVYRSLSVIEVVVRNSL